MALPDFDARPYVAELRSFGLSTLLCLARESFPDGDIPGGMRRYYERHGDGVMWQVGNEADAPPESSSSWVMDQQGFTQLLATGRSAMGDSAYLIAGGMESGDPSWLDAVDLSYVNAMAAHPYGQRPEPDGDAWRELPGNFGFVGDLIDGYAAHGKPLWITEIGVSTSQCSEEFQARYCGTMMGYLRDHPAITGAAWFAFSDGMV